MKHLFKYFVCLSLLLSGISSAIAGETTGDINTGPTTGPEGTVIAPPVATPVPGNYSSAQSVTLTASGAQYICYATGATVPDCDWTNLTCAVGTKYVSPISVASSMAIKALSCYSGGNESTVATYNYTITPPSSSSSGGGGGGGGGGASTATYYLPETSSDTLVSLTDRKVDLPSSGVFTRQVIMDNTRSGVIVEFPFGTQATGSDGEPYVEWISSPARILESGLPETPPNDEAYVFAFNVYGTGPVDLDQNAIFTVPLPVNYYDRDDLVVYYYNNQTDQYEILSAANYELSEDGQSMIIRHDQLGTFLITDGQGDGTTDQPVDEDAPTTTTPFTDIAGHWAQTYIENVFDLDIVNGKTATTFEPNRNITRAELAKVVLLAFGYPIYAVDEVKSFPDVYLDAWFASYVQTAKEFGIINGYPDGTFKPNASVKRVEALKMILLASGLEITGGEMNFPDTIPGAWYEGFVAYAQLHGIVNGYADGNFYPANYMSRAEIAKVISLILEIL